MITTLELLDYCILTYQLHAQTFLCAPDPYGEQMSQGEVGAGPERRYNSDGLAAAAQHLEVDPAVLRSVVRWRPQAAGSCQTGGRRFCSNVICSEPARAGGLAPPVWRLAASVAAIVRREPAYTSEWRRQAIASDRLAALDSASWGLGQSMTSQMMRGKNEHILSTAFFMNAGGVNTALQRGDWTGFARRYNGSAFVRNRYHEKLAAAHANFSRSRLPDFEAHAVQALLACHGFGPSAIDGIVGERTRAAIAAFRVTQRLPQTADQKDLGSALSEMCRRRGTTAHPLCPRGHSRTRYRIFALSDPARTPRSQPGARHRWAAVHRYFAERALLNEAQE
jgi:hypothetical protein